MKAGEPVEQELEGTQHAQHARNTPKTHWPSPSRSPSPLPHTHRCASASSHTHVSSRGRPPAHTLIPSLPHPHVLVGSPAMLCTLAFHLKLAQVGTVH
jgi:hypothetical protein